MNRQSKLLIILLCFSLSVGLSLWIKHAIDSSQYEKAKVYNTAIQATESEVFNYAIDSRQGNVLGSGTFEAETPVGLPELKGTYFQIEKTKERYTRHTETYSCGTSDVPKTCTRTYYEWDYAGRDYVTADTVVLHGREYPSSLFSIGFKKRLDCDAITVNCKRAHSYEDTRGWFGYSEGDIRYYYHATDATFWGTILFNTYNGTIEGIDGLINVDSRTIGKIIKDVNNPHTGMVTFVVLLLCSIIITGVMIKEHIFM